MGWQRDIERRRRGEGTWTHRQGLTTQKYQATPNSHIKIKVSPQGKALSATVSNFDNLSVPHQN